MVIGGINFFAMSLFAISGFGNGLMYHFGWQICYRLDNMVCNGNVATAVIHVSYAAFFTFPFQVFYLWNCVDWKLGMYLSFFQQIGVIVGMYVIFNFTSTLFARLLGLIMLVGALQRLASEMKSRQNKATPAVTIKFYPFDNLQDYLFVCYIGLTSGLLGGMYVHN